jgi:hypothetical protein
MIGTSPDPPAHPQPSTFVKLNPRSLVARYSYPPGAAIIRFVLTGVASGENCTIPNGIVAPGNTFPPFVVPIIAFTEAARSLEAAPAIITAANPTATVPTSLNIPGRKNVLVIPVDYGKAFPRVLIDASTLMRKHHMENTL